MSLDRRFSIGDWVQVQATVTHRKDYAAERRDLLVVIRGCPFVARIVGVTRMYTGKLRWTGEGYVFDQSSRETHEVWLVRRGMTNRSLMVQDKDITPANVGKSDTLVWRQRS